MLKYWGFKCLEDNYLRLFIVISIVVYYIIIENKIMYCYILLLSNKYTFYPGFQLTISLGTLLLASLRNPHFENFFSSSSRHVHWSDAKIWHLYPIVFFWSRWALVHFPCVLYWLGANAAALGCSKCARLLVVGDERCDIRDPSCSVELIRSGWENRTWVKVNPARPRAQLCYISLLAVKQEGSCSAN